MKIPKRFKLLGQTINVILVDDLLDRHDAHGLAIFRRNEIHIQRSTPATPRTADSLYHDFMHELTHWVFYFSGSYYTKKDDHLHKDEALVDMTAGLFHQAFSTMEFDE